MSATCARLTAAAGPPGRLASRPSRVTRVTAHAKKKRSSASSQFSYSSLVQESSDAPAESQPVSKGGGYSAMMQSAESGTQAEKEHEAPQYKTLMLELSQRPSVTLNLKMSRDQAQRLYAELVEFESILQSKENDEALQRGGLEMFDYKHRGEDGMEFKLICNPNSCEGVYDATCLVTASSSCGLKVSAVVEFKRIRDEVASVA